MTNALSTRSTGALGLLAAVVLLANITVNVATAQEPSRAPAVSPASESSAGSLRAPVRAVSRNNGVRVTVSLEGPFVAGESARIRTRVKNTNDKPIWWASGSAGLLLRVTMPEASWRLGVPPVTLPRQGEPGWPAQQDLKNGLVLWYRGLGEEQVFLPFELDRVEGIEDSFFTTPVERIPPGGIIDFVDAWDGLLRIEPGQESTLGLPPSGPVELTARARYRLSRDGKPRHTRVRLETAIVDGWDDERLHPMEAVDAALADPAFTELIEASDFNRTDVGFVAYDFDMDRWYVGSCGLRDDVGLLYWRVAGIDPFTGEVLDLIDGFGDETCDVGSWRNTDGGAAGRGGGDDLTAPVPSMQSTLFPRP